MALKIHPANIYPPMSVPELLVLGRDIQVNGLEEPITLHEGMILDGQNRALACDAVGVQPRYQEWDGQTKSIQSFLLSKNSYRRQLTDVQKAFLGAQLMPHFTKEAKKRQSQAGGDNTASGQSSPSAIEGAGRARDFAAQAVGLKNPHAIDRADRILKEGSPDLIRRVTHGETSPSAAVKKELPVVLTKNHHEILRGAWVTDETRARYLQLATDNRWNGDEMERALFEEFPAHRRTEKAVHPAVAKARDAVKAKEERAARTNKRQVRIFLTGLDKFSPKFMRFVEINSQPEVLAKFSPEGASTAADKIDLILADAIQLSKTLRAQGIW